MMIIDKNSTAGNIIAAQQEPHKDLQLDTRDIGKTPSDIRRKTMENQTSIAPADKGRDETPIQHHMTTFHGSVHPGNKELEIRDYATNPAIVERLLQSIKVPTKKTTVSNTRSPKTSTIQIREWFTDILGVKDQKEATDLTRKAINDFQLSTACEVEAQFIPSEDILEKSDEWEKIQYSTNHRELRRPQEIAAVPCQNYYAPLEAEETCLMANDDNPNAHNLTPPKATTNAKIPYHGPKTRDPKI